MIFCDFGKTRVHIVRTFIWFVKFLHVRVLVIPFERALQPPTRGFQSLVGFCLRFQKVILKLESLIGVVPTN